MHDNTINTIERSMCVGCQSCGLICPKQAISFEHIDGFKFPVIDTEKCIECGLCLKKCPVHENCDDAHNPICGYAAWNPNSRIRINSTSGGLYYSLAQEILDMGGSICACAFTDDYKSAVHILGSDETTINRTMRSKYFQSDLKDSFDQVKRRLNSGEEVLFVGSPCQCKALKLFLGREYSNLLTCDFICRGVNSPRAYQRFIETMEKKYKSKIKSVHFKNKYNGWNELSTRIEFQNDKVYLADKFDDAWVNGYIRGHFYMRECCYSCPYTSTERYGDITIGDFWGYKEISPELLFTGISCVLANTKKGKDFLEGIPKERLVLKPVDISEIVSGNGCLNHSKIVIPEERAKFFERYEKEDFDELVFELLNYSAKKKLINKARKIKFKLANFLSYPSGLKLRKKIESSEVLLNGNYKEN